MTIIEIENNLNTLVANFEKETFIFDLLLAYGSPKSTIKRLQGSDHDKLSSDGELVLRKKLFFKVADENLHVTIDALKSKKEVTKHSPRFIIVTDYETLLAYDTKTEDTLDTELLNIINHYDFFLPLAGMEKATFQNENPADVKASLKMAKLYDELQKNNHFETKEDIHSLNVFLTRLLFCYFAEDTNIFPDNLFTSSVSSHTQADGSDTASYLQRLFGMFNTQQSKRETNTPEYLLKFPYVNGGLFRDALSIPRFTAKSRQILLEIGQLQWSQINPDIFGSMIQAVVTPEHRGGMGMHYTSVPNIMKVIEPLFLDELYVEFEKAYESKAKLQTLLNRLTKIKIFDPACGSGNFLIIAYKKLRELEINILKHIDSLQNQKSFVFSEIKLTQFYGIELDDFAHEVAILSLWLAEHQMNLKFYEEFGRTHPSLPLHESGNIVHGNATRLDWAEVCPKNEDDEIYVLGNPPYIGTRNQESSHKEDMAFVFEKTKNYKVLDYIACWFYLGGKYIQNFDAKLAFVSTNSISQGDQVAVLWSNIFNMDIAISFAHQSFLWKNNAKDNAAVIVVIIGLENKNKNEKKLYTENFIKRVSNINGYLIAGSNVFVERRTKPLIKIPKMSYGNYTGGCEELFLSSIEKNDLINSNPEASKYIRKLSGSAEFIQGKERYCLWISDANLQEALKIDDIKNRVEKVRKNRLSSKDEALRKLAQRPHQFRDINEAKESSIIIPIVSSERRKYIPMGFLDKEYIIPNSAQAIYDAEPWIFGIINSFMHNLWVKTVGGKLKSDYRYSSVLCYNTFPFPNISKKQKEEITELVYGIIDEREKHSQKTLAQLYDPNKMPEGLQKAHHNLDIFIEQCYRPKPFESDEERLEYLFRMYEEMTSKEKIAK
ncbi:MAG: class I SAM-dependent DNA methyltransferase [Epsilonproteobacteria bacterium]|nr:class I SAM-dependent DNA methyltransferase [Campylobacterota bacterium]OIO18119.1 MAG: SAM-dependent methyltransferase [Helicobacteraceae bacterium CG1_02_36_14]PIP11222.1 MAG: SAM-dependent methyltransferase [Sulfurimonas sp. CG23_combo_of_CG06-09_8_20_14_all_36_33]PIS23624.1 MAG: SAM-dependent methyltransferase [Sulfurimonas sp. CG08_land_8_20_14_0_20_36_33]PIU35216.1 MAG: SAM-dependent methyltransferase [Sulfurimonas sp. CG07_land_8_20_14_0_80_36_56]PIV04497.1 MAG: SAM-dependent methylt